MFFVLLLDLLFEIARLIPEFFLVSDVILAIDDVNVFEIGVGRLVFQLLPELSLLENLQVVLGILLQLRHVEHHQTVSFSLVSREILVAN